MRVSTMELLVKRIAPLSGNPAVDSAFRRIIQGYFLTISNPSLTRNVRFRLRITISTLTGPCTAAARDFVGGANANHVVAFDVTCANTFSSLTLFDGKSDYKIYRTVSFTLRPGQSCSLQILPNITPAVLSGENLEIRGFVEIYQPYSVLVPAPAPATLLITAEHRGTVLDNSYGVPGATEPVQNFDFDQTSYALPLASGKAEMEVESVLEPLVFRPLPFESLAALPVIPLKKEVDSLVLEEIVSDLNTEIREDSDLELILQKRKK